MTGSPPVLSARELDGVAAELAAAGHVPAGPLQASVITGGRSNLTYRLGDGVRSWVLRTPPRAGRIPSAHDIAREHRVTAALRGSGVPVADAVLLHLDEDLLGGPFAVSGFVDGRAFRTRAEVAELEQADLDRIVASLVDALVALHRVDHVAVGLTDFGRPGGYAARQLRRWAGQWELTAPPGVRALAEEVVERLGRELPGQSVSSVVHGDYRIDNTLVRAGEVVAVVDWELSTIGDPVADVAMMCAYRDPAFDLIVGEPSAWTSARLPGAGRLTEMYTAAGGHDLEHLEFHLALAHFKIAAIAAGIDHRRRSGAGRGAGFDTAGEAVPHFLERARDALPAVPR